MKKYLVHGVAFCALLGAAAPALAQAVGDPNATVDAVVVTGIRRANVKAIDSKLKATGVVDVVSSNEVQALPDLTIVEALRRVPGLSVLPATDNEHPRDEAATPVIRGLGPAYNNVTIDGSPIASPGTPNGNLGSIGRGVRLDILPSSMISEMAVTKTFTADLDPNAVGGAIDLRTRSAFAGGGKPFFTFEIAGGGANDQGQPRKQAPIGGRVQTTGSFTFGPDGKYGLTASANYQKLDTFTETHMTTDTVHAVFYNDAGVAQSGENLGNGFAVPQQDKYWYVQDRRSRYGLTLKGEANFTDALYGFVTGGLYRFQDTMERNELIMDANQRGTVFNQTATSGQYPKGDVEVGFEHANIITNTQLLQAGLDWKIGDDQVLSARGSASRATYREPITMIKYITNAAYGTPGANAGAVVVPTAAYAFTYDTSRFNQRFNMNPAAFYDLSAYKAFYYRPDYKRSASDNIYSGRIDWRKNMARDARGWGFSAGVSYTQDTPEYNVYRVEYGPNANAPLMTLNNAAGPAGAPMRYSNGLFLLTIDPVKAAAQWEAVRAAGGLNSTDQSGFSNQDNFEHREKTIGAYGVAAYAGEKLKAQFGLHEDSTQQDTTGRARVAGVWTKLPTKSSYDFLLPSALVTYDITPTIDVRFGASQTIGRPSYDSYAARTAINFTQASDKGNANATGVTVTVGNPDIKPRLSTNLDLAMDWRLSNRYGGLFSVAVFNKDIKDEIFNASSQGFTYDGVTYANAVVTRPVNASKASVRGVEANLIVNSLEWVHPWLKNIGVSGNWSQLDGELKVLRGNGVSRTLDRLTGQPDETRNATIFYSHAGLELRAAYNHQGRALRSITPDIAWQDLYWAPRDQVDFQATYEVRPGLMVYGQASNLTHTRMTSFYGPNKNLLKDTYSVPTVFWLGVRFTPRF
ncbi:TonB-dependent receptor [Caulobacter sp. SSI4214]|uniref:TonB-dependent receptor n=1 Tax=Caulobacter sp. SSI4214 TaxID=2575739 RepID=UPI00143C14B8|nr:TonB-dependent receptor [Caulobacter sp. SSI4214]